MSTATEDEDSGFNTSRSLQQSLAIKKKQGFHFSRSQSQSVISVENKDFLPN